MKDDCIPWRGKVSQDGYGQINKRINGKWTSYRAHRVAYAKEYGPIPVGAIVRHKCDQPLCVNVLHLELGTNVDNMLDMKQRGRSLKGVRNPACKLTEQQVTEIKNAMAKGASGPVLAKQYGVSHVQIYRIKNGVSWA